MIKKLLTILLCGSLAFGSVNVSAETQTDNSTAIKSEDAEVSTETAASDESGNVVIMLDPGHDSTHAGASSGGLHEEVLVLAIALKCKEILDEYAGVTVYMTRETSDCPHSGTTSTKDNTMRVDDACEVGASLYISMHLNSASSSTPNGAEVYYPNANGDAEVGARGKALATCIQEELVGIGLNDRGIKYRDSEAGDSFSDGTLMDYYTVIRRSKTYGIAAVIIEHAFITSPIDVQGYLNTDEKLSNVAAADAAGIISYLGLSKKISITNIKSANPTKAKITWNGIGAATKYVLYRSNEKNGEYEEIATFTDGTNYYTDKTLSANTKYFYKVEAYEEDELISTSAAKGVKTLSDTTIEDISSKTSDGTITVEWSETDGANQYIVYRSTDGETYSKLATVASGVGEYTDTGVKPGTMYYYKVRAARIKTVASSYSYYSDVLNAVCLGKTTLNSVKSSSTGGITLKWSSVTGAGTYRIYRSTKKSSGYTRIADVEADATEYTDTDIKGNVVYYYKVRAYKKCSGGNLGAFSSVLSAKALAAAVIKKFTVSKKNVTITWKAVDGAEKYVVQRSTSRNGTYTNLKTLKSTVTTYKDSTAESDTLYFYRIKAKAAYNGSTIYSYSAVKSTISIDTPSIKKLSFDETGISFKIKEVSGADGYIVQKRAGTSGSFSRLKTVGSGDSLTITDTDVEGGTTYYYRVRSYLKYGDEKIYSTYSTAVSITYGHEIMGESEVSPDQMVQYYGSKNKEYPSDVYTDLGAATIEDFCEILYEEANTEGVKAEVVFSQIMLETGYLQFGGDVKAEQCNFAGIGATGGGAKGNSFSDVREGIRVVVQHLKAYASTDDLVNECVDPRFTYVTRGCAKYVEWLSIKNNPLGKGWAADPDYGTKILAIIAALKSLP